MATIQGVYVALFGRPADPTGLAYFNSVTKNGADLTAIGDLASTTEYKTRFEGQSNVQIVNSIYKSLFNRDSDAAGLSFFVDKLNKGELNINNIAIAILDGATTDPDKSIVENKIKAADLFTASLDTGAEIAAYSGDEAANVGRQFLAPVTDTVPDQAAADAAVAELTTPVRPDPILTIGADTITANVIEAPLVDQVSNTNVQTLNSVDKLTGTGEKATLNATLNSGVVQSPTVSGIEIFNLEAVGAGGLLDLRNTTGLKTVNNSYSDSALTLRNVALTEGFSLNIREVEASVPGLGGVDRTTSVEFTKDSAAGDKDAVTVTLDNVQALVDLKTTGDIADKDAGIETLNIVSNGNVANKGGVNASADAVVVTGEADLSGLTSGAGKIDASAFKGKLGVTATSKDVEVLGGEKDDTITVTGLGAAKVNAGAGNDTVRMGNNLGASDALDGGEGTDTLVVTKGLGDAELSVKSFETLQIGNSGFDAGAVAVGAGTYDLSKLAGSTIDKVVIKNSDLATIKKLADGKTVVFNGRDGDNNATTIGGADIAIDGAKDNNANTLNLEIGRVADGNSNPGLGALTVTAITAKDIESINIVSAGSNSANTVTALTTGALKTLKITGDDDLTIGGTTTLNAKGAAVDASAFTGDLMITVANTEATPPDGSIVNGVIVKSGSGDDTITGSGANDVFSGGAGNDLLIGGGGVDAFTGGEGADKFVLGNAATDKTNVTDFQVGTDDLLLKVAGTLALISNDNTALAATPGTLVGTAATAANLGYESITSATAAIGTKTHIVELEGTLVDGTAAGVLSAINAGIKTGGVTANADLLFVTYRAGGVADIWKFAGTATNPTDIDVGELSLVSTVQGVAADSLTANDFLFFV